MDETFLNFELVECIINGDDNKGTLLSCPDEDTMLDAITVIKDILLQGRNPLLEIEFSH
jgi:hypothetical protein